MHAYALLARVTGGNVALAQPLFALLYLATLAVVLAVYSAAGVVPPWALPLLALSKRLHSIYMLRLFNDPLAMLPAYGCIALAQRGCWLAAALAWSLAVSVKMNALLMAPPLALLMLRACSTRTIAAAVAIVLASQVALGAPFLAHAPGAYLHRAFDFGRVFERRWSVNLQFLPPALFASKRTAAALLLLHLAALLGFAHRRWLRDAGGLGATLREGARRLRGAQPRLASPSGEQVATVMLTGNLIGIVFARSLHFQFYAWYALSLPYLAWRARLPTPARLALLAAIEACWNVYPPVPAASAVLAGCHALLLWGLWRAREPPLAPTPPPSPQTRSKTRAAKLAAD